MDFLSTPRDPVRSTGTFSCRFYHLSQCNNYFSCRALQHLISLGAAVAIITLGEKGARFATMDNPNMTAVTADKVETVDTTVQQDLKLASLVCHSDASYCRRVLEMPLLERSPPFW